jgi:4-hydroxy-tetrahydrodipicolinate synthase
MALDKTDNCLDNGIYVGALTPLNADLSCNSQELAYHCLNLMQRGCKGVVLFGTAGEGPSFSVKERIEVLEKVIDKGVDPKKIILANGGANLSETVDLVQAAIKLNISVFLISPPSFFKNVPEEGVISYYREMIQRVANPNLRIILYHIPQYSGVPITLKIIETLLLEFPNKVIGIKESEGNLTFAKSIIDTFSHFKVFVGNERQIIEAVHYGAAGSICGLANLYPELICSLYEQGRRSNCANPQELEAFFQALKGYSFIPAIKAAMEKAKGDVWHWVRPPLIPLNSDQSKQFTSSLEQMYSSM